MSRLTHERPAPRSGRTTLRLVETPPTRVDAPRIHSGARWAKHYRAMLRASDAAVITAAVFAGGAIGWRLDGPSLVGLPSPVAYATLSAVVALAWMAVLGAHQTRGTRVIGAGALEYKRVASATMLAFGMLAMAFLVLQTQATRGFFLLALPIGLLGLLVNRWLWRRWLIRQRDNGSYLSRAILVGDSADVEYVLGQIGRLACSPYDIVGVAADDGDFPTRRFGSRIVSTVSGLDHVADAVLEYQADTVIVAGRPRHRSDDYVRSLSWELERTGASLVLASRLTDVAGPRISFSPVEGLPLMHVELPQFEGRKHMLKRGLDIVASAFGLLVLLPAFGVIAALIKLDSPGPVFFRQERVGRNGRTFSMVKFRSMVATAEHDLAGLLDQNEGAGVLFKIRHDPRVTPLGRVLRKFSLDELPQLWNVLRGDMSIVGPRPPLPREVDAYERDVHRRLYIKPGLTGMWQVSGRSELSWDESVRLDLYYVENWSLTVDLMIIWRTIRVVLKPEGAY
ncbi:sugar transferase [Lysobacter korlensis]|uniref:Sugar transferase n=1 Tax=Lysobacter korlensis TaxID=553636 RepID=A0ABV6RYS6_9GAMM